VVADDCVSHPLADRDPQSAGRNPQSLSVLVGFTDGSLASRCDYDDKAL